MKSLFVVAVIAGALLLCGAGSVPAFANVGAGVSVELVTTVTGGGSSGGGGGYRGGGGGGSTSNWWLLYLESLKDKSTEATTQDTEPEESVPNEPSTPAVTEPETTPPVEDIVPEQKSPWDWLSVLVIVGMVALVGVLAWLVFRKRKPKPVPT